MHRDTITQTKSLFQYLRDIQNDLEQIQAKCTFIEENWEGFPDTFPVEESPELPDQDAVWAYWQIRESETR